MVNSYCLRECFEPLNAYNGSAVSNEKTGNTAIDILHSYYKNFLDFVKGNGGEYRW
jgi:hypothetical protein